MSESNSHLPGRPSFPGSSPASTSISAAGTDPAPRRYLALDPGSRRTGVAVSDELGLFAHPRPAITAASRSDLVASVARLAAAEDVDEVVVGLPLTLTGAASAQAEAVMALVRELALVLPIPVTTVDERLSTVQATRQQPAGGRRARDGSIDSAAAAIVLQSLLDSLRVRG